MTPLEAAAGDAILVGDPRRAFALAQELTSQPRMSHQARGLWGYRGTTDFGDELTIQSTGVGGPSAVPVIGDLVEQGIRRVIRLGTCLAIDPDLRAGSLILVEKAAASDGASRSLNRGERFTRPDQRLFRSLDGLGKQACVSSHDLVARYDPESALSGSKETGSVKSGSNAPASAVARDLQTAATLAMCRNLEVPAAALLIVAEDRSGTRLDEETLWEMFRSAGKAVTSRLSKPQVEG